MEEQRSYEKQVKEYIDWMLTLSIEERVDVLLEDFNYKIEVVQRARDAGQTFRAGCSVTYAYAVLYREYVSKIPARLGGGEAVQRVDIITCDPRAEISSRAGDLIDGFLPVSLFAEAIEPRYVGFDDGSGFIESLLEMGL